jgi:hypothetical protein
MSVIVGNKSSLPDNLKLLPMAEQRLDASDSHLGVIDVIKQIDLIFFTS